MILKVKKQNKYFENQFAIIHESFSSIINSPEKLFENNGIIMFEIHQYVLRQKI